MTDVERHAALCEELHNLYIRKNRDYGDSFRQTWEEEGVAMARIRLNDKLARFKHLTRGEEEAAVDGESIRDTLMDLAGYSILTIMEMEREGTRYESKPGTNEQSGTGGGQYVPGVVPP